MSLKALTNSDRNPELANGIMELSPIGLLLSCPYVVAHKDTPGDYPRAGLSFFIILQMFSRMMMIMIIYGCDNDDDQEKCRSGAGRRFLR